ncbi:flagellar biosynthesis protein, protein export component FlhB [Candidatus Magnetomorum sp. HK-1]|nr:flagellar biosynthesis protein, protein export component FlhB [Candidatus Magnetomorum sp. HK-1]
MAAETETGEEKTEAPTGKRRGKAREEGQVAKSVEVGSVAVLLSGLASLYIFGTYLYGRLEYFIHDAFGIWANPTFTDADFLSFAKRYIEDYIITLLPIFLLIMSVTFIVQATQVGGIKFAWKTLKPKLSAFNPLSGLKRILFSPQSLVELSKSVAKLVVVGWIAYVIIRDEMSFLINLGDMEIRSIFMYILSVMFRIFLSVSLVMIFIAVLDYAYRVYEHEKNLKMTKQEIKDENKQSEGDPQVKQRIKAVQREMAMRRMMEEVPKADVVVTNPIHLAIALKYENFSMSAPKVLAKGAGLVAENIKKRAKEHDIPIVENKELARNLFSLVEIGSEIPTTLYQAVAEVLAYVYRLKGKV